MGNTLSDTRRMTPLVPRRDADITRRRWLHVATVAAPALLRPAKLGAQTTQKTSPLALQLARVFAGIQYAQLPAAAVANAKMIVASTLASAAAGTQIESARIIETLAKEQGGRAEATVWFAGVKGKPMKLPLAVAVRVNAMLSDAAASDDSDLRNVAHTGTALTAVGLAIGELTGATGEQLIAAMVAGYEAAGRFGDVMRGGRPGVHASLIVAFGGTVAAARLLGLTPEQMAHAISITSTTMGGILMGTDSWAREYMAGNAALCAINAALAARRGFTVNEDLLEVKGGFLDTFGNRAVDLAQLVRAPGPQWDIERYLAIKLVPGAHAIHSTMEAALNVRQQAREKHADFSANDVAKLILAGPAKSSVTYDLRAPKDMVEAIHSLPYFVGSAVADGKFDWTYVTPEKIRNPAATALIARMEYDKAPPAIHYDWNWGGTVTLITKTGERYTSTVDAPRGSGPRGIEWKDVDAKFRALFPAAGRSPAVAEQVLGHTHALQSEPVRVLVRAVG